MDYGIYIDIDRCIGCQACAVACMDQNDLEIDKGECSWRTIYRVEKNNYPVAKASYISMGCMHCQDAPCIMGCPTGAIWRAESGRVAVDESLCIGCHSCLMSCPFGVPRYNIYGKMRKCDLCWGRVEAGLEPACVRVCPGKALKFGPVNELSKQVESKAAEKLAGAALHPMVAG